MCHSMSMLFPSIRPYRKTRVEGWRREVKQMKGGVWARRSRSDRDERAWGDQVYVLKRNLQTNNLPASRPLSCILPSRRRKTDPDLDVKFCGFGIFAVELRLAHILFVHVSCLQVFCTRRDRCTSKSRLHQKERALVVNIQSRSQDISQEVKNGIFFSNSLYVPKYHIQMESDKRWEKQVAASEIYFLTLAYKSMAQWLDFILDAFITRSPENHWKLLI